jgi:hypothetical protein
MKSKRQLAPMASTQLRSPEELPVAGFLSGASTVSKTKIAVEKDSAYKSFESLDVLPPGEPLGVSKSTSTDVPDIWHLCLMAEADLNARLLDDGPEIPDDGTKTGAETFMSDHLNSVLNPFLREFISVNTLFFQLGTTLGTRSAVKSMLEFETMEVKVQGLCRALSRKTSLRGRASSVFTLLYSGEGKPMIDVLRRIISL